MEESTSKQQLYNTSASKSVTTSSEPSSSFGHKQQYSNDDTNTSILGNGKTSSCASNKSTEKVTPITPSSQSTQRYVQNAPESNFGGNFIVYLLIFGPDKLM